MKREATAKAAAPISGSKLYQQRARAALPLLVRQAESGVPISYGDLAAELEMPNPRNLNYVLGSVGRSLQRLSKMWGEHVPPIQCLVLNQTSGLPGKGIGWFLIKKETFSSLPLRRRREIVQAELQRIYSYSRWRNVLDALSLKPALPELHAIVATAASLQGGESDQHKALKEFVACHPEVVGLNASTPMGQMEYPLPSGDCLDVSFSKSKLWVAAEVKSLISAEADIARGLFQCVKYQAVMDAALIAEGRSQSARAVLVLEAALPASLIPLKNLLGVEVVEGVKPRIVSKAAVIIREKGTAVGKPR